MSAVSALLILSTLQASSNDAEVRNGLEAVQNARRACTLTRYQMPEPLDILAGAYAEAGRFDEAVRMAEFAAWFARAADKPVLALGAEQRLALYGQKKPFRRAD